jgi:hypothetical protein
MAKVAIQGGGPNYLGKQKEVKVPVKWKSSPDHPDTELAYITEPEKKVLIALNMHGGLEDGKPNKGPKGIISLQGDMGSVKSDGKGGHVGTGGGDYPTGKTPKLPPAVAAAIAAGKPTSVDTREDEKRAKREAREFRETKYGQGYQPINFIEKASYFQRQRDLELAKKRALQKYKDVEQYLVPFDDYTMSGQKMAELRGYTFDNQGNITGYDRDKATAYGYDIEKLAKGKKYLGSNIGTDLEKYRENLYDVNSLNHPLLNKLRPDTQRSVLNTLGKAAEYNILGINAPNMTNQQISDEMYRLRNLGRTQDQINFIEGGPSGGGGGQQYIPYLPPEEDEVEEDEFEYRFGNEQKVGADVTRGFYNQGGRIPRAFGGIMDSATGRKAYGLGSIFKSVGKAIGKVGKAAGKVLSSDLGKAAIAGAMFYYGGGGAGAFKNKSFFGGLGQLGKNFMSTKNPLLFSDGAFNPLKMAGLITLGGAAMGPAKQDSLEGFNNRGGRLIDPITGEEGTPASMRASLNDALDNADGDPDKIKAITNAYAFLGPDQRLGTYLPYETYGVKDGGLIRSRFSLGGSGGQPLPADPTKPINPFAPKPIGPVLPNRAGGYGRQRVMAEEGGLMNLGGMEKDYRNEGGFVPIGREEKADDVPARLSVNEFVFTADAVRNAGGGDIDKGAEVMENMMKNLENGGRVSEESQGNTGAQEMFSVSERIGEVI